MGFSSATEYFQCRQDLIRISTGSGELDKLLQGLPADSVPSADSNAARLRLRATRAHADARVRHSHGKQINGGWLLSLDYLMGSTTS